MTLLDSMKVLMPLTPEPADPGMQAISDALEAAITTNIRTSFVPGIGVVFLANLAQPNPVLIALAAHLDVTITPIISAALAAQPVVGGPLPAWASVQPSFDALMLAAPPFMAGLLGVLFWQAILITIRFCLPPPPPDLENDDSDGDGRVEVLRIDN